MKVRIVLLVAVLAAFALVTSQRSETPSATADAIKTTWVSGLKNPRGLAVNSVHDVLIAEQGTGANDARLLSTRDLNGDGDAMDAGEISVIAENLPSVLAGPPGEEGVAGVSAISRDAGGTYWVLAVMGESASGWLGKIVDGAFVPVADLGAYEAANDPNGDGIDSNPYDLVVGADGLIYVDDAAGNDTLRVDPTTGVITTYAVYQDFPNPTPIGPPTIDAVPTGIDLQADGRLAIIFLSGFPFPQTGSYIAVLEDRNGDGDARDAGEALWISTGATATTDLTHNSDGVRYVTEVSTNLTDETNAPPGDIFQYSPNGNVLIVGGLIGPTSLTYDGRALYVSEEFAGTISRVSNWPYAGIDRSVKLLPGWNQVTYSGVTRRLDQALTGISDDIGVIYSFGNADKKWSSYDPAGPAALNTLNILDAEQIVWINVTGAQPVLWYMEL